MKIKRVVGILLIGALWACNGSPGSSGNAIPGTPVGAAPATASALPALTPQEIGATLELELSIPNGQPRSHYVSVNTKSVTVTENGKKVGTFNTTARSKGCKTVSNAVSCSFKMGVAPGAHKKFGVTTYGKANGKGPALSSGLVTKTIAVDKLNKLTVTLNGIVNQIIVGLSVPHPITGQATTMDVTVTALDASGATIVAPGNYNVPITLADSDTSGTTVLSGTTVTGPSSAITLAYNGAALTSATISATATGVSAANITPATLLPTTLAGVTESGAASFAVISDGSGNAVAFLPGGAGLTGVPVASKGKIDAVTPGKPALRPHATGGLTLNPVPNECAPDLVHAQIYCITYKSNVVSIVGYDPADVLKAPELLGQTTTDAPLTGLTFSGATCTICSIAFDPKDNAYIISTANGYELWPITPGATAPIKTLPAPISENFGYNGITDQIFSPFYSFNADTFDNPPLTSGLDLIDVTSGNRYVLNQGPYPYTVEPDAGAVDTTTNIGIAPEEASEPIYLDNLNVPPAVYTAPTPFPSPSPTPPAYLVGSYTSPVVRATPPSTLIFNCDETYSAIDSQIDVGFFGSEYCGYDYAAVAQLPTPSTIGTLAISNYVIAQLPNTPNGNVFVSPLDPHAIVVVNLPGICADCGVLVNSDSSYLAIINIPALLALNPSGGELDVPTTNTLSGILQYVATGFSTYERSPYILKLAQAHRQYRLQHPYHR